MTVNDTFKFKRGEQVIVHQLSEREKQDFGEKQAKVYGFGSVKQWRTVMMIETNLGYKFNGSNYWDLKDFISKYFESTERKDIQDEK
ncbi:hypothetical protein [Lactococcus lactis]|uniref:hypothetical protein n=1 Tax=Lactococcus lactis TaxID=1358 RepID=UPI0024A9A790|nr:hypothetical protein [Lactococcus lactis]